MNRRRRAFVTNSLMILDGLTVAGSYILTYVLRNQLSFLGLDTLLPFQFYFPYLGMVMIIWLVLLRLFRTYAFLQERIGINSRLRIMLKLIPVEILGLTLVTTVLFFFRDRNLSRTFLVFFGAINFISLSLVKSLTFAYIRRVGKVGKYHRRVLLIGHKKKVAQFAALTRERPELLLDIVTVPDFIRSADEPVTQDYWDNLNYEVVDFILNHVVDEVLLAYRDLNLSSVAPLINDCGRLGIMVNVVLDTTEIQFHRTEVDALGPFNIVSFQSYDYSPYQRFFKRLLDLTTGIIGSVVFLFLYIFLAPLIKLTSSGPVLFIQPRKGKNGRTFRLFKFRTMYNDAEARKKEFEAQNEMKGHIFKLTDDPRITPLGRFMRKTSLDEFPQFINILRGDMSLVGTRPPTVQEYDSYEMHHRRRLSIQPGLTGLWQVSGRNEISDFEEIVKLDTYYIDHWSIWLDLKIILKTFTVMFSGK